MSRKKKLGSVRIVTKEIDLENNELFSVKKSSTGIVLPITGFNGGEHITACDNHGKTDVHAKDKYGNKLDLLSLANNIEEELRNNAPKKYMNLDELKIGFPMGFVSFLDNQNPEQLSRGNATETKENSVSNFNIPLDSILKLASHGNFISVKKLDSGTIPIGSSIPFFNPEGTGMKWYRLSHESDYYALESLDPIMTFLMRIMNFFSLDLNIIAEFDNQLRLVANELKN